MAPPGRVSSSQTGLVNPSGPHHCAMCRGSVQASKTRAGGASMMRVIRTSRSSAATALFPFPAATLSLLRLQLLQTHSEPSQALVPEPPVEGEPLIDLLQPLGRNAAGPPLRLAAAGDES